MANVNGTHGAIARSNGVNDIIFFLQNLACSKTIQFCYGKIGSASQMTLQMTLLVDT